jgi:hypothetical protein
MKPLCKWRARFLLDGGMLIGVQAWGMYTLLLIQPPVQDFYETAIRLQPLGLCSLKAVVQQHVPEFRVIVKDYHHGWGRRTIPLPRELRYLRAYYAHPDASPFSTFYHYYHFGAPFEQIAAEVAEAAPDLVGISALFSPYAREVVQCAQAIKPRLAAPIIVGGHHASAAPEHLLAQPCIDGVIRGEGERPLVEFLRAWITRSGYDHVPNLGWKQGGKLILNPMQPNYALDDIPQPDVSDCAPDAYQFEGRPLSLLMTSRGCPYRCAFCAVRQTFGPRYRRRSVERVLRELHDRYAQGYRVFDFEDDNLTFDRAAMRVLCMRISAEFPAGSLELLAMNGLSYLSLDAELLAAMKAAGFRRLNLSLVSANAGVMRQMSRPHALAQYVRVVREGVRLGFRIVTYQILGLPSESLDSMLGTLALNAGLPVLLGASPFYAPPGAPIMGDAPPLSEAAMVAARLTALGHNPDAIARDQVFTLFVTTRILNFFKGLPVATDLALPAALNLADSLGGRTAVGAALFRKLCEEGVLYADTGKTFEPLPRFRADLFFRFWSCLPRIMTQQGHTITTSGRPA